MSNGDSNDLNMYRTSGSDNQQELYTRKRIHDLVEKLSNYHAENLRTQQSIMSLQDEFHKSERNSEKEFDKTRDLVNTVDRRLVALEQQVGLLNRLLWLFMTGVCGYIVARFMNVIS